MEFQGRITEVMPARTGTRQDGSAWTDLSFVFAYYENGEQRFEDTVIVSTFDTNIMAKIAPYIVRDQDRKAIVENGVVKLNVSDIPCRCGFSHKVKTAQKKDGTGSVKINEIRCYRLEVIAATQSQPTANPFPPAPAYNPAPTPYPPQNQADNDDLPF